MVSRIPRDVRDAAEKEASRHGARLEWEPVGRSHPHVTLHLHGQHRRYALCSSPRTDGQCNYVRQAVKRMVTSIKGGK